MVTAIIASAFLLVSDQQMEAEFNEFSKIDCKGMVESLDRQCKSKCASKKKKAQRECIEACTANLDSLEKNCKKIQNGIKSYKNTPKSERERLMRQEPPEDHRGHSH